ncbi:hypothetical protein [Actinomadura parmotrematis]|uniref:RNA polymerase alpha subunit C-terminal domain-containing protein n=1 Tax=Actinomadura parmotrematis TaxID=2864039 RepID=A0ABS7G1X1_9ACTN|nr:hypothetical protein [Actinomadura parmotrematis]MBW8486710.1 hypothetical protein [Actinomadura parmotrematis]
MSVDEDAGLVALGVSARTRSALRSGLRSYGDVTVGDVARAARAGELREVRNIGPESEEEIMRALRAFGLLPPREDESPQRAALVVAVDLVREVFREAMERAQVPESLRSAVEAHAGEAMAILVPKGADR